MQTDCDLEKGAGSSNSLVTVPWADYVSRVLKKSELVERVKQQISLMPADVTKLITDQELVDVVQYMTTLKKTEAAGQ